MSPHRPLFKETIDRQTRNSIAFMVYRTLIGVAFLFAAFHEFPDHKGSISLGYLLLLALFEGIGITMDAHYVGQNALSDQAERKTRHAIVLAAEQSGSIDQWDFWATVERRMSDELKEIDPAGVARPWWKSTLLVIGSLVWRLIGGFVGVGIVSAMTS